MSDGVLTYSSDLSRPGLAVESLIDLLRSRAESVAQRRLYTFLSDGPTPESSLTCAELDLRARSIGAWLQSAGASGQRVLLLFPPGLDYIAAFFGCLYAKAIAVPAYPPRRNRNLDRLRVLVDDARPALALTTQGIMSQIKSSLDETPDLKALSWQAIDSVDNDWAERWQPPRVDNRTLAFLQYTSGSTANPKGVMITHGNLLHNERIIQDTFGQTDQSIIVGWLPLFHDMGLIGNVLQPLYVGAQCILLSPASFLQRPLHWLETISRYRGTTSGGPNFAYDLCVRKSTLQELEALDLSSWTIAFNGSEPVRKETLDRFCATFEPCGFRREAFFPCYGLAEATLLVSGGPGKTKPAIRTYHRRELEQNHLLPALSGEPGALSLVGCGNPTQMQIRIVDPNSLTECPAAAVGEIWISGESVAQGYWDKPLESDHTFHARLADTLEGTYLRTGDLGFVEDGELFITGRLKDLIIIRGRNCYPEDIEQTVGQCDPALRPGEGVAFSADISGEERLIVVHEIPRVYRGSNLVGIVENIRRAVAEEYDLQLYAVALLKPGTLLRTSSGKTQRQAMKQAFLQGSLDVLLQWHLSELPQLTEIAPLDAGQTDLEETKEWIACKAAAVLGLSRSQIDLDEPLVRYGLDSLAAVELAHGIEQNLGASLKMPSFMPDMCISEIAARLLTELESASGSRTDLPSVIPTQSSFPLSHGQAALWFLHRLAPQSAAYNVIGPARIRGDLDKPALQRAFQTLIERHPLLRVRFESRGGDPLQIVQENVEISFLEVDVSDWAEAKLTRRISEEAHRPFDLENGPVFRVTLFSFDQRDYLLLLTAHHIVIDMWSLAVLLKELDAVYEAEISGTPHNLPTPKASYDVYVSHQAQLLAGPRGLELREYWRRQLSGELPVLDLTTDYARPSAQTYDGASESVKFDSRTVDGLAGLARNNLTTLYTLLLTAYLTLLHRHTGQQDLIVGSPTSGRTDQQFQSLAGYFVNPVPIRAKPNGDLTFRQFLAQVRETVHGAFEHQEYPFSLLVNDICPDRDPSRSPVFQTTFVFESAPLFCDQSLPAFVLGDEGTRIEFNSLTLESVKIDQQIAQFDLSMVVLPVEGGFTVALQYNKDLFKASTISRMLSHFKMLVDEILACPEQRISEIPILPPAELRQLLKEFNDTQKQYPATNYLHQLFEAQVEKTPWANGLAHEGWNFSYRELNTRANKLAHYLRTLGVAPEVRVAVLLERWPEMVISMLAILKAGGAYLPLDPNYPTDRLAFMMEDARASVLISRQGLADKLPRKTTKLVCLDSQADSIAEQSDDNPHSGLEPENLSHIIYTSGSTGRPKGVAIEHRSVVNFLHWAKQVFSLAELSGVFASTSICFDLSVFEIFAPLSCGGTTILANDALHLATHAAAERVTLVNTVPSAMAELLRLKAVGTGVLTVNLAGEALKNSLVQQAYAETNVKRVLNLYGPTEYTTYTTGQEVERGSQHQPTIGRAIANTQVYIVDERMRSVPIGVVGEVCIGGLGLARCYLNRPGMTAERFIPDSLSGARGSRLYRSGDLGRYSENGEIEYLGRKDHQVKIRGYRIELGEIESALVRHPAIKEAVIAVREDSGGDRQMVSYVVTEPGKSVVSSELRDYLRETLPAYMVPQIFMTLATMPLTSNGKVDRRSLPAPDATALLRGRERVKPRNPLEEVVSDIWSQVLGLEQVGRSDNFFEIGGHSLKAVQVISRLSDLFQVELPVRVLFEAPTVQGLANVIEQLMTLEQGVVRLPIERASRDGAFPLSFAQQRLWFLHRLDPRSAAYNVSFSARITGPLNLPALEQSLNETIRRHDALRTTFEQAEGKPVQTVAQYRVVAPPIVDLDNLTPAARAELILRLIVEEARHPFDLEHGPLLRITMLRLGEGEYALLLSMHHIVSDGWSAGVFIREMMAHYEAFSTAKPSPLPDLNIQYVDFAVWQRQAPETESVEAQLAYWKRQLSGAPALLNLPSDRPRPPVRSQHGAVMNFALPRELRDRLVAVGRRNGATLFMTLLAGFQLLLSRYSGQTDVLVGTPIANRGRPELEQLIGCFVNTLVMRTDLSDDPTFRELLCRVRSVAVAAYTHQGAPFERVVSELTSERDLSRTPLFQVAMVLQNTPLEALTLGPVKVQPDESDTGTAKFDMTLQFTETEAGLAGRWEYSTDLFDAATIERMATHFQILLEGIVENPERHISELPMLSESDRLQLLVNWSSTTADQGQQECLHELFERQATIAPDATAVVCDDEHLTYAELNIKANQLAHQLIGMEVGPEVRVGIMMESSLDMLVSLIGVLKAGGAYVPLDPTYPSQRIAYILEDCGAALVLTQARLAETLLSSLTVPLLSVDRRVDPVCEKFSDNPPSRATKENLAYVIYTSGSTGQPKGVLVTHDNVTRLFASTQRWFQFNQDDVWTLFHSFAFDFSVWEIWGALLHGGRLVIVSYWVSRSPESFYDLLCRERVTILNQTPSAFYQLSDHEKAANVDDSQPGRRLELRCVIFGGEALEFQSLRSWIERHGDEQPRLINMYGITETSVHVTYWPISRNDVLSGGSSIIGHRISDLRLYVLDQRMEPVPVRVSGELYVGGAGVARGYMNHGDWTAERFVPDPLSGIPGARLYRTGDLGRCLISGAAEYLGRCDEQVKIQGFRIELGEIEATLAGHPAVRATAVVPREDDLGHKYLVGYVACRGAVEVNDLRAYLQSKLPSYMVPAIFMFLERLPLTRNGKIDLKALPEPIREIESDEYVAPRTHAERALADIWAQVLKVERVGVHDNFFDLGGDSILSIQVVATARRAGLLLTPQQLFQHQTIAKLALIAEDLGQIEIENNLLHSPIERHRRPEANTYRPSDFPLVNLTQAELDSLTTAIEIEDIEDLCTLTPLQEGMLYHILDSSGSSMYLNQQRYTLQGDLDVPAFRSALQKVIDRHQILRTAFMLSSQSNPVQLVFRHLEQCWREYDWRDLPLAHRAKQLDALLLLDRQQGFDLASPPLTRVTLVRVAEDLYEFIWTFHLLLLDGWSIPVVLKEILAFYGGFRRGQSVELEPPVRYADYIDWLLKRSQVQAEAYWRQALAGFTGATSLGEDRLLLTEPEEEEFNEITIVVEESTTTNLRAFAARHKLTLNTLVQGAWALLLSRRSGSDDVCFGSVVSGRPPDFPGIESAVGMFLNTLPARVRIPADCSVLPWLEALQTQQAEARNFEFCSLVDIQGWSDVPRGKLLFESVLIFQNIAVDTALAESEGLRLIDLKSTERTNYPLTLIVLPESQLLLKMVYKCSRFDNATIVRILENLQRFLIELATNPEAPLSTLSSHTEAQRRLLVNSFNQSLAGV